MSDRDALAYLPNLTRTTWKTYALLATTLAGAAWFFYGAFWYQFFHGHQVTGRAPTGRCGKHRRQHRAADRREPRRHRDLRDRRILQLKRYSSSRGSRSS